MMLFSRKNRVSKFLPLRRGMINQDAAAGRGGRRGKKRQSSSPPDLVYRECKQLLQDAGLWRDDLASDVPRKWERHGDLALLPEKCFADPAWAALGERLWSTVCRCIQVKWLARKSEILADDFRSPRVAVLHDARTEAEGRGETWAGRTENGVRYTWDITRSMFSAGNITEKMRVAKMDCGGEVVVDMFAGIGYFSLPFLLHSGAAFLHACEWNPAAAEALRRNLAENKIDASRYQIHEGDNRASCPRGVADRVNLGLIPSAEGSFRAAAAALKAGAGGVMHVHGNVRYENNNQVWENASHGNVRCEKDQVRESASSKTEKVFGQDEKQVWENTSSETEIVFGRDEKVWETPSDSGEPKIVFAPEFKFKCRRREWREWALETAVQVRGFWDEFRDSERTTGTLTLLLMTRVKSYAPRVDHLVLDLKCE